MKKTFLLFIALCLVYASSFAADRSWDFTSWSQATLDNMAADATNWEVKSTSRYSNFVAITANSTITANGVAVAELDGLTFGALGKDKLRVDYGASEGASKIILNGGKLTINIPNCEVGDEIRITFKSAGSDDRGFSGTTNVTPDASNTYAGSTSTTNIFTASSAGTASFTTSGGLQIFSVSVRAVVTDQPSISLQSGSNDQTVYPTQNIKNIVYKWGGSATSAAVIWTDGNTPAGITVTTDDGNKTITIAGAPTATSVASYAYSITSTDGTNTTEALTGTIAVKVTNKYKLAYVTTVTSGQADARDQILFDVIKDKFDINVIDATEVGVDYSIYDVVVTSAVPNSSSAGIIAGSTTQAAALNKPFVQMKTFVVNNSRWNWVGAASNEPGYSNAIREIALTSDGVSHKLFNGTTLGAGNTIKLIDDAYDFSTSNNNGIVTFDAWSSHVSPTPVTLATPAGQTAGSYAEIPTGTQLGTNATDVTTHPVILLGLSEASWNNLTEDAKTIVSNALRYVVNDTFGVGVADNVVDNTNKVVAHKEYYDIMGKKLSAKPVNAIGIEKIVYEDGSVEYVKVRYAK